jgi:hypothetical protein
MPVLLHKLGLGEYAVPSCSSPFRQDTKPSWGIFQWGDHWFFKDHGTDEKGDEITLLGLLYKLDPETDFRDILDVYENILWETQEPPDLSEIMAEAKAAGQDSPNRAKPNRDGFKPPSSAELEAIAGGRPYGLAGLTWANERGVLVFNPNWHGMAVFGVTDASGKVLELRRVDHRKFPAVPACGLDARKSHAVKGSRKAWPLGILEAREYPAIALLEGVPDFIEAHDAILREGVQCAPVAMLSSACKIIAAEALPFFKGKRIRIFCHADSPGIAAADAWQRQLIEAGATHVDLFDFSALEPLNSRVNDLYEFSVWRKSSQFRDAPGLSKILPDAI